MIKRVGIMGLVALTVATAASAMRVAPASAADCRRVIALEVSSWDKRSAAGKCEEAVNGTSRYTNVKGVGTVVPGETNTVCYEVETPASELSGWSNSNCTTSTGTKKYIKVIRRPKNCSGEEIEEEEPKAFREAFQVSDEPLTATALTEPLGRWSAVVLL